MEDAVAEVSLGVTLPQGNLAGPAQSPVFSTEVSIGRTVRETLDETEAAVPAPPVRADSQVSFARAGAPLLGTEAVIARADGAGGAPVSGGDHGGAQLVPGGRPVSNSDAVVAPPPAAAADAPRTPVSNEGARFFAPGGAPMNFAGDVVLATPFEQPAPPEKHQSALIGGSAEASSPVAPVLDLSRPVSNDGPAFVSSTGGALNVSGDTMIAHRAQGAPPAPGAPIRNGDVTMAPAGIPVDQGSRDVQTALSHDPISPGGSEVALGAVGKPLKRNVT